jgi:murein L,D-transpeptidase YcbB/YkuD
MKTRGRSVSIRPSFSLKKAAWPRFCFLAASLILAAGCGAGPEKIPFHPARQVQSILEDRVGAEAGAGPIFCRRDRICGSEVLPIFYRSRDLRPAWIADDLDLSSAASFIAALRRVEEDGLNPWNYHLAALEALMSEVSRGAAKDVSTVPAETLADLEMLLTDAFLLCGSHLVHGQVNPETIQSEWFIKGRYEDLAAVLKRGIETNDVGAALESLKPVHPTYRNLKAAFKKVRAEVEGGGRPDFAPGPKLKPGDTGPRVKALREYLRAVGDLPLSRDSGADLFDAEPCTR